MSWNRTVVVKWVDTVVAAVVLLVVVLACIHFSFPTSAKERVLDENRELAALYDQATSRVLDGESRVPPEDIAKQHEQAYHAECDFLGLDRDNHLYWIDGYDEVSVRVKEARLRYESALSLAE